VKTTPRYLTPSELTAICNAVDRVTGELDVVRHIAAAQNGRNRQGIATVTEQIETRRDIAKHVRKLDGLLSAYYTATACVLEREGERIDDKAGSMAQEPSECSDVVESGSESERNSVNRTAL
jgi:hypothetical protein